MESVVSFLHEVVPQASKKLCYCLNKIYLYNVILYLSAIFALPVGRVFHWSGISGYLKAMNRGDFIKKVTKMTKSGKSNKN